MVNSRAKGSRFELKIASDLFDALGIKFERILDQVREAGLGDLRPVSGSFPFTLELKHYIRQLPGKYFRRTKDHV